MNFPPLAILAGGLATRMRPVTERIPKSLIPVCGEPFLAHQLRLSYLQGFRKVVLCVGHLGNMIEEFILKNGDFGLEIEFSFDGDVNKGTGGAVQHALAKLDSTFFVLYGDSYLDIDIGPIYRAFIAGGVPAMMTVLHNRHHSDLANVDFDGKFVRRHSKSLQSDNHLQWIDFGLNIMSSNIFQDFPKTEAFDLSSVTSSLAENGQLLGFEVHRRFYEIGSPNGLLELEGYLRRKI